MLPNKVKNELSPNGKNHIYLINITNPEDIRVLSSYRKHKEYQKDPHIFKPYIQTSDNDATESGLPLSAVHSSSSCLWRKAMKTTKTFCRNMWIEK